MPDLVEVGRTYAERGGLVIAVSQDLFKKDATVASVEPKVAAMIERFGITFPVVLYDGELEALNDRFDLPGPIPATVAIDTTGSVVDMQDDVAEQSRMVEMMERALGLR